jgi:hypothetical protein
MTASSMIMMGIVLTFFWGGFITLILKLRKL